MTLTPVTSVAPEPLVFLTTKQIALLTVLVRGNPDGTFCDLDELLERLGYKTTKQSVQFSIRALIKHDLVEKKERESRRGRSRVILAPTVLAYGWIKGFRPGM